MAVPMIPVPSTAMFIRLERLLEALEPLAAEGDDVEPQLELHELRVRNQPRFRGSAQAALFLLRHHLEGITVSLSGLRLHLAEDELPPAAKDQVELVASDPDVRAQDAVAAQAVVPQRPPLRRAARRRGIYG